MPASAQHAVVIGTVVRTALHFLGGGLAVPSLTGDKEAGTVRLCVCLCVRACARVCAGGCVCLFCLPQATLAEVSPDCCLPCFYTKGAYWRRTSCLVVQPTRRLTFEACYVPVCFAFAFAFACVCVYVLSLCHRDPGGQWHWACQESPTSWFARSAACQSKGAREYPVVPRVTPSDHLLLV